MRLKNLATTFLSGLGSSPAFSSRHHSDGPSKTRAVLVSPARTNESNLTEITKSKSSFVILVIFVAFVAAAVGPLQCFEVLSLSPARIGNLRRLSGGG